MITDVTLTRFKRFNKESFKLNPTGLTICAGPNSSGKSTLLHALAVWSFGTMVVKQFKGPQALLKDYKGQGAGLSKDDFTPINTPDLRHLWYNLKSQIPHEGYSMSIEVKWNDNFGEHNLTMAFSLVQDRLFIKAHESDLEPETKIPNIVYVPPVAGVDAREEFATPAKRRAMLGRGLAGSVLRNFLLDMDIENKAARRLKQGEKKKLSSRDLSELRENDSWELLNESMRETFGLELRVEPFNNDFHSIIRVEVLPRKKSGTRWIKSGPSRDLMVEGAGAQQWLTVLAFALSKETNVLLLDEPDAHLFTRLKHELVEKLDQVSQRGTQILLATHATEILKRHPISKILNFGVSHPKYLADEMQRTKLISGMGDEYAPLIEKALSSRIILFVENESDARILEAVAKTCEYNWPPNIAIIATTDGHGNRIRQYRPLAEAIDGLKALSIRDRDTGEINEVCADTLCDKGINTKSYPEFRARTWRRREVENYALNFSALLKALPEEEVLKFWRKQGWASPPVETIERIYEDCDIKHELGVLLGKETAEDFLKGLEKSDIHQDLKTIAKEICSLAD